MRLIDIHDIGAICMITMSTVGQEHLFRMWMRMSNAYLSRWAHTRNLWMQDFLSEAQFKGKRGRAAGAVAINNGNAGLRHSWETIFNYLLVSSIIQWKRNLFSRKRMRALTPLTPPTGWDMREEKMSPINKKPFVFVLWSCFFFFLFFSGWAQQSWKPETPRLSSR